MAIRQKPVKILKASAGSGKTFTLTAYYLELLFAEKKETKYKDILAVTFTNKATAEMKSRILEELKRLAEGDIQSPYSNILLGKFPEYGPEGIREKANKIFRRILHDYSHFSIMTIDSFVQKVIRGFAFELGLEPGFKIEINTEKVKKELIYRLEKELDTNSDLLNHFIDIVLDRIGEDTSWDYRKTFSTLAEQVFKEDFRHFENVLNHFPENSTYKEVFDQLIRKGRNKNAQFLEQIDFLLKDAQKDLEGFSWEPEVFKGMSSSKVFKFKKNFQENLKHGDLEKLEDLFVLVDDREEWFKPGKEVPEIYTILNPYLEKMKVFYEKESKSYFLNRQILINLPYVRLFPDLIRLLKKYREESGDLLITDTQTLLEGITLPGSTNPSFIWEKIGNRFRNYLLDEFQDTSQLQWNNFMPLLEESISTHFGNRIQNLIVGDVKQSIYRWRNGDYELLYHKAEKDLGQENIEQDSLGENFRSHRNIIDFNNNLFTMAPEVLKDILNYEIGNHPDNEIKEWWNNFRYHDLFPNIYKEAYQKAPKNVPEGGKVKIWFLSSGEEGNKDEEDEEENIFLKAHIQEIKRLIKEEGYTYSDMAILVKTNDQVKKALNALLEKNLPVVSGDALILGKQKVIDILIHCLYYLNDFSGKTKLNLCSCLILLADIENRSFPQEEILENNIEELEKFLPEKIYQNKSKLISLPLGEIIEYLMDAFRLNHYPEFKPFLLGFRDLILDFSQYGEEGIRNFLDYWEQEGKEKGLSSGNSPNAIQISTIHKAKGLAYRAVFIPFGDWSLKGIANDIWISTRNTEFEELGLVPVKFTQELSKSLVSKDYFKELMDTYLDSLNTLYVALTRARDFIFITSSLPSKNAMKTFEESKNMGNILYYSLIRMGLLKKEEKQMVKIEWGDISKQEPINGIPSKIFDLETYSVSGLLSEKESMNSLDSKNRFRMNKAAENGNLLHQILSKLEDIRDLDKVLLESRNEGLFLASQTDELKIQLEKIMNHWELKRLMENTGSVYRERTILAGKGAVYRPDKILFKDQETLVLDYKFTQNQEREHKTQVLGYADLLKQMGYPGVRAYLFYGFQEQLIEVFNS